jgi:hypothetical protein
MDLQEIHRKTNFPLRKLRYVLDHEILPGTRIKTDSQRWGHPRSFTDFEGFSIALAAALLGGGLRRELVTQFFDKMNNLKGARKDRFGRDLGLLYVAFSDRKKQSRADIADGQYVAIHLGENRREWSDLKSSNSAPADYKPLVIISIDLGHLRDAICAK